MSLSRPSSGKNGDKSLSTYSFSVDNSPTGFCMIEMGVNEEPIKDNFVFDAVAVMSVPIKNYNYSAAVSDKLSHSVVFLLSKSTGKGVLCEYTNKNNGKVIISTGRMAKIPQTVVCTNTYKPFSQLSAGFYTCLIHFSDLKLFSVAFEKLRDYDDIVHNCHIFHRSLVTTAMNHYLKGRDEFKMLYNYKEGESLVSHMTSSHLWIEVTHKTATRKQIKELLSATQLQQALQTAPTLAVSPVEQTNTPQKSPHSSHKLTQKSSPSASPPLSDVLKQSTFTLDDMTRNKHIPLSKIEAVCIQYDRNSKAQKLIQPTIMELNLSDRTAAITINKEKLQVAMNTLQYNEVWRLVEVLRELKYQGPEVDQAVKFCAKMADKIENYAALSYYNDYSGRTARCYDGDYFGELLQNKKVLAVVVVFGVVGLTIAWTFAWSLFMLAVLYAVIWIKHTEDKSKQHRTKTSPSVLPSVAEEVPVELAIETKKEQ